MKSKLEQKLEEFRQYIEANPDVPQLFEGLALKQLANGRIHASPYGLVQIIRSDYHVQRANKAFKMSDQHTPYLARLAMLRHPRLEGFFTLKKLTSANRPASFEQALEFNFGNDPEDEEEVIEFLSALLGKEKYESAG